MIRIEDRLAEYVDRLDADSTPITPDEVLADRPHGSHKRGRALLAAGLAAVALAAVVIASQLDDSTHVTTSPAETNSESPPPEALAPVSDDVSLWLSTTEVAPGDTEVIAVLLNHTGVDTTFGVAADIERWDGRAWVPHRQIAMCLDHWHCTAESVSLGDSMDTADIGLVAEPGSPGPPERFTVAGLDEGWYRVSQTANEEDVASGVLRVVDGAEPQVPMWPIDEPAISLAPSILSTDGGTVALWPLVPPTDGSLFREDIEEAVEGLSEIAIIERWNGAGWDPAGEVPLAGEQDVEPLARSADLPPLVAGAYRLVRTGPDGTHVGNFWVVEHAVLDGEAPIVSDGSDQGAGIDDRLIPHTIRLPDAGIEVTVDLPARFEPPPNPREPGNSLPYVERWLDPENRHLVGLSIQQDPGDDAPLFQMLRIQQFDSPLGVWTVHSLGGDGMETAMAMLRHEGFVYQVTGGVPHAPGVARDIARSLRVEQLEAE